MRSQFWKLSIAVAPVAAVLIGAAVFALAGIAHTPSHLISILLVLMVGVSVLIYYALGRYFTSDLRYRGLVDSMDDVILILDANGRYLEVLQGPDVFATSFEGLVGKRIHDLLTKGEADHFVAHIRKVLTTRSTTRIDYSLNIDGRPVWFEAAVSPLSQQEVIWVARDITARHEAERKLQQSQARLEETVRRRTHELRLSEERYRSTLEQVNDIIFSTTPEGVITSLNPAFERFLGHRREAWIGRPFDELMPEDRAARFETMAGKNKGATTRAVVLNHEGERLVLELTLVDHILDGEAVGCLGVARDVTARERAEEELRRSEHQLAEAQRIAHVGSWEEALADGEIRWSYELYRILGLDPEREVSTVSLSRFVIPEDLEVYRAAEERIAAGESADWEVRVQLHDGTRKTLHLIGRPISRSDGAWTHNIGTVQDVTEIRAADRKLRESDLRFQLVGRATNDVIWDWDLTDNRLWWGEGMENRFGYDREELEEDITSWSNRVHPDDHDRVVSQLERAVAEGDLKFSAEYRFRTAAGDYASVFDRGSVIRDSQGNPVRMVGALMDVTERKRLEEQLAQQKRVNSLGRVAASIAHEFNNVLMGIQPNIELIRRRSSSDLEPVINNIATAIIRGKRVTGDILRYTRSVDPSIQCVDIASLLDSWAAETRPLLGNDIDLEISVSSDSLYVNADRDQLIQVLANLANNARDAMESEGGTLSIMVDSAHRDPDQSSSARRGELVRLLVSDTGHGIAPADLAHVFEPFFTTRPGGTGLGLAIGYQIVQAHDGAMFVESDLGKGTSFEVLIPAAVPERKALQSERRERPESLSRVLLVEDEEAVALGLSSLLDLEGIAVRHVVYGGEALAAVEEFDPHVVLLDIGLPDMDGADVYRDLADRWPGLPIIFSSGHADASKLESFLARPNVDFIQKPYEFAEIMQLLADVFEATPRDQRPVDLV